MVYAEGRTFFDADSHIMELPSFLLDFADPKVREQIPPLSVSSGGPIAERMQEYFAVGKHTEERVAEPAAQYNSLAARTRGIDEAPDMGLEQICVSPDNIDVVNFSPSAALAPFLCC